MAAYDIQASIGSMLARWIEYAFEDAMDSNTHIGVYVHPLKDSEVRIEVCNRMGGSKRWDVLMNGVPVALLIVDNDNLKVGV